MIQWYYAPDGFYYGKPDGEWRRRFPYNMPAEDKASALSLPPEWIGDKSELCIMSILETTSVTGPQD